MIANRKQFTLGFGMMAGFAVVLVTIFLPIFDGQNGLNYLDSLYNSISKASANYLEELGKKAHKFEGKSISLTLPLGDPKLAEQAAPLFARAGALAQASGPDLKVEGDLGLILANCLEDAGNMFENRGEAVSGKYGIPERQAMFNWWKSLKALEKGLNELEMFPEGSAVSSVNQKGVECVYNYYQIVPKKISEKWGTVVLSLVFYVGYTIWYGFAILFLFQGVGLRLEH